MAPLFLSRDFLSPTTCLPFSVTARWAFLNVSLPTRSFSSWHRHYRALSSSHQRKWDLEGVAQYTAAGFGRGGHGWQTCGREVPWGYRVVSTITMPGTGQPQNKYDCWTNLSCKLSFILIQGSPAWWGSRKTNSGWASTMLQARARCFTWIIPFNPRSPQIRWLLSPFHRGPNKVQGVRCLLIFLD